MKKYEYISPRDYIGDILIKEAEKNNKIVVIDSDLASSVTTHKFQKKFPERFFEMGIAEQNSLGVTAGLATEGFVPFYVNFAIFGTGTVWTQLRQSCYANLNIKIIGTHPGMDNGPDGASHHALEDIALTRVLPNLKVFNPIDLEDLKGAIKRAVEIKGPIYIRVARDVVPVIHEKEIDFNEGNSEMLFNEGNDYLLIFEGTAAKQAIEGFELLKEKGYKNKLLNIRSIKPVDKKAVLKEAEGMKGIVTIENHTINGGLGGLISEIVGESVVKIPLRRVGVQDKFTESGKTEVVKEKYGLSGKSIVEIIETF
ncbi:MAG: transketolase C-terminal domain-containing protein [Leptotrichiaceae bacterium]|nr:transketolase C-terminal domain-containing protein [Leptotrichiaceae bacterium]